MNPYPKSRARHLRQNATSSEEAAWNVLREFRKHGFPVRRQHPVEGLIVDFAIHKAKLIIEIDGGIHNWTEVALRDGRRTKILVAAGWQIIRFSNEQARDEDLLFSEVAKLLGIS